MLYTNFPHFIYWFTRWWVLGLFPIRGNHEECIYKGSEIHLWVDTFVYTWVVLSCTVNLFKKSEKNFKWLSFNTITIHPWNLYMSLFTWAPSWTGTHMDVGFAWNSCTGYTAVTARRVFNYKVMLDIFFSSLKIRVFNFLKNCILGFLVFNSLSIVHKCNSL